MKHFSFLSGFAIMTDIPIHQYNSSLAAVDLRRVSALLLFFRRWRRQAPCSIRKIFLWKSRNTVFSLQISPSLISLSRNSHEKLILLCC